MTSSSKPSLVAEVYAYMFKYLGYNPILYADETSNRNDSFRLLINIGAP